MFVALALMGVALGVSACASVQRNGAALPPVAKSKISAPVKITDNGRAYVLDNGIVKAEINKRTGNMMSMMYKGIELMGNGPDRASGIWEEDPSAAARVNGLTDSVTIDPTTNGGERGEVSVKGVTKGQVALSIGSPGSGNGTSNIDLEIRYTLGRGESGIYTYAIFSHPAAYAATGIGESRFIIEINRDFNWLSVDADRNMLECAPTDWGTGVVIHAKEQRILSQGVYKNSVEHKYSYTAVQYKTPAYGWSSTKNHIGVWFINPTIEYLSGGASKQELDCHLGDNADPPPIILDYWRGTHYGGGATCNIAAGEKWSKVIGPIFIYCNALAAPKDPSRAALATLKATAGNPTVPAVWKKNATALWQDALDQAKKEKSAWPYDWVDGVDYPHKEERGNVTGQLVLVDPQAATTRLPHLTVGLAHPDYARGTGGGRGFGPRAGATTRPAGGQGTFSRGGPSTTRPFGGRGGFGGFGSPTIDWTHDAKFYQFWNDGADDGTFTITNVRPGTYTLHAFADGVLGEFAQANITVEAGKTLQLGTIDWKPVRDGKQIWEIGYPDRTGGKFYKGDGDDYWLWGWCVRYGDLFPNDITYTIGKSDYRKDWFFEEVPHATSEFWKNPAAPDPLHQRFGWMRLGTPGEDMWRIIGHGRATTWTIKFNMDRASKGQAALRIALAGADGFGGLQVGVNGEDVGTIRTMSTNALRYNTDKSVWYQYTQTFDASLLKAGENEMTLTVPAGELTSGVVYDYLRLELNEDYKPVAPAPAQ
jgi:rhamnogalacturonan endolyase